MVSLKMWCLLSLAALLLLSIVPTVAEVVGSMSNCSGFLLEEIPPRIPGILEGGNILNQNRYKPICQTLNDTRSFVTLYDTENKIPVFSAYKYIGKNNIPRPKNPSWNIEPQLENITDDKNMRRADRNKTYNYQAGNTDYNNSRGFNRGHLFPSSYAFTENDKNSTFTLTNIVPQDIQFNGGSWANMESCIRCVLDEYCINNNNNNIIEGFLVTGAQPSTNNFLNNKINIPSMLWSAFCCYSKTEMKWLASAHWGENTRGGDEYLQTKTLAELHNELGNSSMFPGTKCPLNTTVTQLYPTLNKDCKCPPSVSTTSAPPTTTSGPLSTTSTPLSTTSAPLTGTSAQPSSTSVPHTTTSNELGNSSMFPGTECPLHTTVTQLYPTLNKDCKCPPSVSTTSAPPTTTSGPLSTTSTPLSTTSAPLTCTSAPLTDTSAPPSSTSAAFTDTSAPHSTTSAPLTGTSAQPSSTSVPHSTTSTPHSTTSAPLTGTSAQPSSTSIPHTITSTPHSPTSDPLSTTSAFLSGGEGGEGLVPPLTIPGSGWFFRDLEAALAGLLSLIESIFSGVKGSVPPHVVTTVPKTYNTTLMSVITPANPSEFMSTIPAKTVSVAATKSTCPPDSRPDATMSLHKTTTIPEKAMTSHPVTTTQQSSAITLTPDKFSRTRRSMKGGIFKMFRIFPKPQVLPPSKNERSLRTKDV